MSKGVVLVAINNDKIDYLKMAYLCALFIRKNLGDVKISIITDDYSRGWYYKEYKEKYDKLLDKIIIIDNVQDDNISRNVRVYRDTNYYSVSSNFNNKSRSDAFDLSPYDETLLIDTDYLVMSDLLNKVWDNSEDILINSAANNLIHEPLMGPEFRLNDYGIRMYWATIIYFKKTERAKLLFEFVKHIKEHWDYYKLVYEFPGGLFRNDYAFSIAIHVLNGFLENDEIKSLPNKSILTLLDKDQIYKIINKNEIKVFVNDTKENWKFYVSKIKNIDVHCMNKLSLMNNFDEIVKTLENE